MKRTLITLSIILTAIIILICIFRFISNKNLTEIKEYERSIIKNYRDTYVLDNTNDRDEVLDKIEVFLFDNQPRLFIKDIYRIEDSITIVFAFGDRYMIYPSVKNMK